MAGHCYFPKATSSFLRETRAQAPRSTASRGPAEDLGRGWPGSEASKTMSWALVSSHKAPRRLRLFGEIRCHLWTPRSWCVLLHGVVAWKRFSHWAQSGGTKTCPDLSWGVVATCPTPGGVPFRPGAAGDQIPPVHRWGLQTQGPSGTHRPAPPKTSGGRGPTRQALGLLSSTKGKRPRANCWGTDQSRWAPGACRKDLSFILQMRKMRHREV